ncbi:MAG: hypothetical protein NTX63_05530 [Candidatus Peregrinibacteria bacterium]|nr:hypothetical protein [Candidatus Peregrinibacteria bacterium]
MADTTINPAAQALEAPTVLEKTEFVKPGATVDDLMENVQKAMAFLDIPLGEDTAIADISGNVQAKLAQAAPEGTDDTETINALFAGILSAKKLLEHEGLASQYGDQIALWERDLNDPQYQKDFTTILKLKDLLRNINEEAQELMA